MKVSELKLALELVPEDAQVEYVDTLAMTEFGDDLSIRITNIEIKKKGLVVLR